MGKRRVSFLTDETELAEIQHEPRFLPGRLFNGEFFHFAHIVGFG